jgi:Rrf2 family transcriptional regulator, iron-sulfur cluster assembly transcription factor
MFSKSCEYAIRAMIYIAGQSLKDLRVSLRDIAQEIDSPVAFTAKILQQLSKNKVVSSVKGPAGGFYLSPEQLQRISLANIVRAVDGDKIFKTCGLGLKDCSEKRPCPVHHKFKAIRAELCQMLDSTTVTEMALGLKTGLTFLRH